MTIRITKENILAHRGLWENDQEKNSKRAILRALYEGYGIETDIRPHSSCGREISHDPRYSNEIEVFPLDTILKEVQRGCMKSVVALNIKADGLHGMTKKLLTKYNIKNYFLFDMSIPDMIQGNKYDLIQYSRMSIYERPESLVGYSSGLWLDTFGQTEGIEELIEKASMIKDKIALVSPELHGERFERYWKKVRSMECRADIMICTDNPVEAEHYFE